jgi:hypothetical protein
VSEPTELLPKKPEGLRQIVFNALMNEDLLSTTDGWWGTSDVVEYVDKVIDALLDQLRKNGWIESGAKRWHAFSDEELEHLHPGGQIGVPGMPQLTKACEICATMRQEVDAELARRKESGEGK